MQNMKSTKDRKQKKQNLVNVLVSINMVNADIQKRQN